MNTPKITFSKFEGGKPGDERRLNVSVGMELVGEISVDWKDSTPGMMRHTYVVAGYWAELYDIDDSQKFFDAGTNAKAALKAAKAYITETIIKT